VKRRRLWLFAILVYLGLDLCLPDMPGAFMFDPDGSIRSMDVVRARPAGGITLLPPPPVDSRGPSREQPVDLERRLPTNDDVGAPAPRMTSHRPRAACAAPAPPEDPH
jgi:hypothetical protein